VIALSSAEAEYVALTEVSKELTWIRSVAEGLNVEYPKTVTVYTDSQSAMSMVVNQRFSNRTKHVEIKYHYVREEATKGNILLKYVSTDENVADMMTKPLGPTKIAALREKSGLKKENNENKIIN
jgi:hypothetical protein